MTDVDDRPEQADGAGGAGSVAVDADADALGGSARSAGAAGAGRLAGWARANRVILAIALVGLVLRLFMVLVQHPTCELDERVWQSSRPSAADIAAVQGDRDDDACFPLGGDAFYLFIQGKLISEGEWFVNPLDYAAYDRESPGGAKPPLYPLMVAGLHVVGLDSITDSRVANAILGSLTVLAVGVFGRRLGGRRAGAIAAGLAAVYPMMLINDWRGLQDGTAGLPLVLSLMAALTFVRRPSPRTAAVLGLGLAATTLMRSELSILLLFLVPPLVWALGSLKVRARLRLGLVVWAVAALALTPWLAFNAARFDQPTNLTAGMGSALLNGSCDTAWYGNLTGWLDFECFDLQSFVALEAARAGNPDYDESTLALAYQDLAVDYIQDNVRRYPVVAVARVGRIWDVYRPMQNAQLNATVEGRDEVESHLGLAVYAAMVPFALFGLLAMARRRTPISPFVAVAASVSFTAALAFGLTRFRGPAEPVLALVAGIGVDAAVRAWRARSVPAAEVAAAAAVSAATVLALWVADRDDLAWVAVLASVALLADAGRRLWGGDAWPALEEVGEGAQRWPTASMLGPGRTEPWWRRGSFDLATHRRAALGAGAAVVLVVAVLGWSFTAEPAPAGQRTDVVAACTTARERGLDDVSVYGRLGQATVGPTLAGFAQLRAQAPAPWQADIDLIVGYLTDLQASGLEGGPWLRGLPEQDRAALFGAAGRLLGQFTAACGELEAGGSLGPGLAPPTTVAGQGGGLGGLGGLGGQGAGGAGGAGAGAGGGGAAGGGAGPTTTAGLLGPFDG